MNDENRVFDGALQELLNHATTEVREKAVTFEISSVAGCV